MHRKRSISPYFVKATFPDILNIEIKTSSRGMIMTGINWEKHIHDYERSGQTMKAFCAKRGLNFFGFRNQRYRYNQKKKAELTKLKPTKSAFKEFQVGINLQITVNKGNQISIHGISADHLPNILRAIDAVS